MGWNGRWNIKQNYDMRQVKQETTFTTKSRGNHTERRCSSRHFLLSGLESTDQYSIVMRLVTA